MTNVTPIQNTDAEQAVIAILASKLAKARIAEIKAWTAYTDNTKERTPEKTEDLRVAWLSANAEMTAVHVLACDLCEQIGAGWRELDMAFNNPFEYKGQIVREE